MTDADHLDALARALADAGWSSSRRYEGVPALIHVFASDVPSFGESVLVTEGTGGVPWFISSMRMPLAPCHDLAGAVAGLDAILTPLVRDRPRRDGRGGAA